MSHHTCSDCDKCKLSRMESKLDEILRIQECFNRCDPVEQIAASLSEIAANVKRWVDFQIKPVGVVIEEGKETTH